MLTRVWTGMKVWLAGVQLTQAIERNQRAADDLDRALRKVLRR